MKFLVFVILAAVATTALASQHEAVRLAQHRINKAVQAFNIITKSATSAPVTMSCTSDLRALGRRYTKNPCITAFQDNDDDDSDEFSSDGDADGDDSDYFDDPKSIRKFCQCKNTLLKMFGELEKLAKGSCRGEDINLDELNTDVMRAAFEFVCIKSGDKYCVEVFRELDQEYPDFGVGDNATSCEALAYCGCCCGSLIEFVNSISNISIFSGGVTSSDIDDVNRTFSECGYDVPRPCVPPGETSHAVKGAFKITITKTLVELGIDEDGDARRAFIVAFVRDFAAEIGVPPPAVQVTNLRQGSIIVDYTVLTPDATAANTIASTISALPSVNLTNVRLLSSDYTAASFSSVTADASTVSNNETDSPAAVVSAGVLFALLAAVAAIAM